MILKPMAEPTKEQAERLVRELGIDEDSPSVSTGNKLLVEALTDPPTMLALRHYRNAMKNYPNLCESLIEHAKDPKQPIAALYNHNDPETKLLTGVDIEYSNGRKVIRVVKASEAYPTHFKRLQNAVASEVESDTALRKNISNLARSFEAAEENASLEF